MSEKDKAKEAAWNKLGITMFRPPTPKELRETFDFAFDAGYNADGWRRIETDGLPEVDGEYWIIASDGELFPGVATFKGGDFLYGDVVAWAPIRAFPQELMRESLRRAPFTE